MTTDVVDEVEETAEDREALAAKAFELDQAIKGAMAKGRVALWELAGNLYELDEMQGWIQLGYDDKPSWLADPEISMTQATFYRLVSVWREFVVIRKVQLSALVNLDTSKLAVVLPKLQKREVTKKEALNDVEVLGWRDLRIKYMNAKELGPDLDDDEGGDEAEGDRGLIDKEKKSIIGQAEMDWEALREELVTAAESGQAKPRIDAKLIRAGVQGANILIEQWRLSNERSAAA